MTGDPDRVGPLRGRDVGTSCGHLDLIDLLECGMGYQLLPRVAFKGVQEARTKQRCWEAYLLGVRKGSQWAQQPSAVLLGDLTGFLHGGQ